MPSAENRFLKTATVIGTKPSESVEMKCPIGKTCIILVLAEKFDMTNLDVVSSFYSNVPMNFSLVTDSGLELKLSFYGLTTVNQGQNGGFAFTIDENLVVKDIEYGVHYKSSLVQGQYSWVLSDKLTFRK